MYSKGSIIFVALFSLSSPAIGETLQSGTSVNAAEAWHVENQIQQAPPLRARVQENPPFDSSVTRFDYRTPAPVLPIFEPFGPSEHMQAGVSGGEESYLLSWAVWHKRLAAFVGDAMNRNYRRFGQPGGSCLVHIYVSRDHRLLATLDQSSPSMKGDFNNFVLASYNAADNLALLEYPEGSHRGSFDYVVPFKCFNEDVSGFNGSGIRDMEYGRRTW